MSDAQHSRTTGKRNPLRLAATEGQTREVTGADRDAARMTCVERCPGPVDGPCDVCPLATLDAGLAR